MASRNAGLDPLVDADLVERDSGICVDEVRRRIARRMDVGLQGLVDGLEVLVRLALRIVGAVEEVGVLGSVRLGSGQIHRCQAEPLGKPQDRLVTAVDQLATKLGALSIRPVIGELGEIGVHTPADASRVRLVDR